MASHNRTLLSFTAAAALALAAPAALASNVSDSFTLPNGTNMGPNWTEAEGNTVIDNNMGKGATSQAIGGKGWMHHKTFKGQYADSVCELDFLLGAPADAIMLMAGMDPNSWNGICVKLQDNDGDGLFDRVFFEQGFNAGAWAGGPSQKFDLQVPIASGHMKLWFAAAGDTAVIEINDPSTSLVEVFAAGGILGPTFGSTGYHFGIGHAGQPRFDNWTASATNAPYGAGCKGTGNIVPTLVSPSSPHANSNLTVEVAKGLGGAPAIFFLGLGEANQAIGLTGCKLLVSPVPAPSFSLPLGGAGPGAGSLSISGFLPASTAGVTFTMQAFIVDAGVPHGYSTTNGLRIEIQ